MSGGPWRKEAAAGFSFFCPIRASASNAERVDDGPSLRRLSGGTPTDERNIQRLPLPGSVNRVHLVHDVEALGSRRKSARVRRLVPLVYDSPNRLRASSRALRQLSSVMLRA